MKLILDRIPTLAALAVCSLSLLPGAAAVSAQGDTAFDAPGNLNPIIPGYFDTLGVARRKELNDRGRAMGDDRAVALAVQVIDRIVGPDDEPAPSSHTSED